MAVLIETATPVDEKDEWRTPLWLFRQLEQKYGPFDFDAAATRLNSMCAKYLGPGSEHGEDALLALWAALGDRAWLNPPYSRQWLSYFIRYAHSQVFECGLASATLLVPSTTDVRWFHDLVWDNTKNTTRPGVTIEFLTPRVKFLHPDGTPSKSPSGANLVVDFRRW